MNGEVKQKGISSSSFPSKGNGNGNGNILDFNLTSPSDKKESPWSTHTPLAEATEIAQQKGVSLLKQQKASLEAVREVQSLKLTKIQERILDAITEEKLECASLPELVKAYDILKKNELLAGGKATQITGIVGYLLAIEKEELEAGAGAVSGVKVVNPNDLELEPGAFEVQTFGDDEAEELEEEQLPCL